MNVAAATADAALHNAEREEKLELTAESYIIEKSNCCVV